MPAGRDTRTTSTCAPTCEHRLPNGQREMPSVRTYLAKCSRNDFPSAIEASSASISSAADKAESKRRRQSRNQPALFNDCWPVERCRCTASLADPRAHQQRQPFGSRLPIESVVSPAVIFQVVRPPHSTHDSGPVPASCPLIGQKFGFTKSRSCEIVRKTLVHLLLFLSGEPFPDGSIEASWTEESMKSFHVQGDAPHREKEGLHLFLLDNRWQSVSFVDDGLIKESRLAGAENLERGR